MLKEFVEAISQMAVKAFEPKLFPNPSDLRTNYVCYNGQLTEVKVTPPLLSSPVETFDSLFKAVDKFGGEDASIWHNRAAIVALLDNVDRLEEVHLTLRYSDQFNALKCLPKAFDQRSLILFLKRNLADAVSDGLISIFRQIDFSKREEGGTTLKHGDESLGRSVHAAIASAVDIPEYLTATICVYSNPAARWPVPIKMSVDIDVQRCTIELTPLPDEIENAVQATQDAIGERLRNNAPENVTVFNGSPTMLKR